MNDTVRQIALILIAFTTMMSSITILDMKTRLNALEAQAATMTQCVKKAAQP